MKKLFQGFIFLTIVLSVFSAHTVLGADFQNEVLPDLRVSESSVRYADNSISVKFEVSNQDKRLLNGINYRVNLFAPTVDEASAVFDRKDDSTGENIFYTLLDEQLFREEDTLASGGEKIKTLQFADLYNLAQGNYLVTVDLLTGTGLVIGSVEGKITIAGDGGARPIRIIYEQCFIETQKGEEIYAFSVEDQEFLLDTEGDYTFKCVVENNSGVQVTLDATITDTNNYYDTESVFEFGDIIIPADDAIQVELTLPAEEVPSLYESTFSLFFDERIVSNVAKFFWVVEGKNVRVLNTFFDKGAYAKGDDAVIDVYVNSVSGLDNLYVEADLYDERGEEGCGFQDMEVGQITDDHLVQLSIPLIRDCHDPILSLSFFENDEKLTSYSTIIKSRGAIGSLLDGIASEKMGYKIFGGVVVLIILVLVLIFIKRRTV